MNPKVSICLPNLNNYRYLPERLESIIQQTLQDWELIVVDSYSDDGAWELIQNYADREPRMRIFQAPRKGIYAGFNACVDLAQGTFIYIATSDDTMATTCLEKMVIALEQNPDCALCQCALELIDENSCLLPPEAQWQSFAVSKYLQDWIKIPHKRIAPHDGILHFAVNTVYTSVTQLLIRKQVFETIGGFRSDWGAMGDFEWEMRASLLHNTVFIPQVLATWRVHSNQATTNPFTSINLAKLIDMASHALTFAQQRDSSLQKISFHQLAFRYQIARLQVGLNERPQLFSKLSFFWKKILESPCLSLAYILRVLLSGKQNIIDPIAWVKLRIRELNISEPITIPFL